MNGKVHVYKLTEEELKKYRDMPPPPKYKDVATLAPQREKSKSGRWR